jgi:type IV pilus assembly protein PilV
MTSSRATPLPRHAPRQHGFSLIEVLVAVVVLSLGLLGLAGLQAVSLGNNQTAQYRSIATQQAYDMADRIRANLTGVGNGNYDNLSGALATVLASDPACIHTSGGCTSAQVATTDYAQWRWSTSNLLPDGGGTIRCIEGPAATCVSNVANSARTYNITVTWIEKNMGDTGATSSDANCPAGTPANTRCFLTVFTP